MNKPGETTSDPDIETSFLSGRGRMTQRLERFRLAQALRRRAGATVVLTATATWLPLLILAAIEGVAWGDRVEVPLVRDFLPYGQFFLAVPVLILGEISVGRRLGLAAAELRWSNILAPQDTQELDKLLSRAAERWRGWGVNMVFVIVTCAVTGFSLRGEPEWLTGGWQYVGGRISLPGWWYLLVGMTVLRFLVLRWSWRFLLWVWVLWRTARLTLQPRPTHPDRAGGLAFLGATQAAFGILVFALSVQVSCLIADAVCYRGADLMAFKAEVLAFVVIAVLTLLLPLLVFTPKLMLAQAEGRMLVSGSAYRGAEQLEQKLHSSRTGELPANEITELADFGALYENALRMSPVPLNLRHVLTVFVAAALPFSPLVFLVMPAEKVFRTLGELVL